MRITTSIITNPLRITIWVMPRTGIREKKKILWHCNIMSQRPRETFFLLESLMTSQNDQRLQLGISIVMFRFWINSTLLLLWAKLWDVRSRKLLVKNDFETANQVLLFEAYYFFIHLSRS